VGQSRRPVWPFITAAVLLLVLVGVAVVLLTGGGDKAKSVDAQTVSFQKPTSSGPDPFTKPADVEGDRQVDVSSGNGGSGGSQPFGGSGSNRVCDRDKLIRFLEQHPAQMREWARVLGIDPTIRAVKKYIAKLHPVTLTRDTRITNHAFRNGQAVPFQAILQAGTAVLVDKYGSPVVRCYCGNPLKPAVYTPTAKCTGCPANYKPPRQCRYGHFDDYDDVNYRRTYYDNSAYDEVFIKRHTRSRYGDCYEPYPDPPTVTIVNVYPSSLRPVEQPQPQTTPAPAPAPEQPTLNCDAPRSQLEAEQCHPPQEAPQTTPDAPPSGFECPSQPPAHPGEDYLRYCG
jgi:uncharacterized protein DUF6777